MKGKKGLFLTVGAIAGFIAGVCLAPKEGSETRNDMKDKISDFKENPNDVLRETFNGIKRKINSIKEEIIDENDIEISEEDILISKTFEEGDK